MEYWWEKSGLSYNEHILEIENSPVSKWTQSYQTPLFLYSWPRVHQNIKRLSAALNDFKCQSNLLYAMKANRFSPLLSQFKHTDLGIDACSLNEVQLALNHGFAPEEISATACFSPDELIKLASIDKLAINCDSLNALKIIGKHTPGREIGIRINPAIMSGATDNALLQYSGKGTTKFGIYPEQLNEALEICQTYQLKLTRLHCHLGCGLLDKDIYQYQVAQQAIKRIADTIPTIKKINLGGGLGVPRKQTESPLNLALWVETLNSIWGCSTYQFEFEPGEYLVQDAGYLVLSVQYEEVKANTRFIFVDGGFNLAMEPAFYNLFSLPVPCQTHHLNHSPAKIVGNINEAIDVWDHNAQFPPTQPNDKIVLLNTGAYAASMASEHCLRSDFQQRLILT